MGQTRPLFVYFRFSYMTNVTQIDNNDKSEDGVLGTRTQGDMLVGSDQPTELYYTYTLYSLNQF